MKSSLIHFCIALAVFVAVGTGYAGWYSYVERQGQESASLLSDIELAVANVDHAAKARDALASLGSDEAAINAHFVSIDDIAIYLAYLEVTGRSNKATVDIASVADKPSADGRVPVTLRIAGTFDSVMRTIGAMEYGPYDTRIVNVNVNAVPEGNIWTASLNISVGVSERVATPKTQP